MSNQLNSELKQNELQTNLYNYFLYFLKDIRINPKTAKTAPKPAKAPAKNSLYFFNNVGAKIASKAPIIVIINTCFLFINASNLVVEFTVFLIFQNVNFVRMG